MIIYPAPLSLVQVPADYVFIGPASGSPALPTFRPASGALPSTTLNVTSPNAGNFQVAHGLSSIPSRIRILLSSAGSIWAQTPTSWDSTYVYLTASDTGLTALVSVFQ
jgi:hypothetical protein